MLDVLTNTPIPDKDTGPQATGQSVKTSTGVHVPVTPAIVHTATTSRYSTVHTATARYSIVHTATTSLYSTVHTATSWYSTVRTTTTSRYSTVRTATTSRYGTVHTATTSRYSTVRQHHGTAPSVQLQHHGTSLLHSYNITEYSTVRTATSRYSTVHTVTTSRYSTVLKTLQLFPKKEANKPPHYYLSKAGSRRVTPSPAEVEKINRLPQ